ncbi:N-terminal Xaa-Pro-Lys N-methyltransferase 2 isoform X2 [Scleropages formosus]|uniref:N-terminal Xaa-Pro-Lys N-methyltransferase 2 isoform X2 n=1 Tax=Scleropages formosus TaxID=113540 RepID=UPI000878C2B5|nr:alpha N-terminal protein methyltransferase 1B isoform X2 [Scleropages formosus]
MEYRGAHLAFRRRWKKTDNDLCRHSMSFVLHNTLRNEFFASYLYLLEQIPLVKLYAVTCEYINGEKQFYAQAQDFYKTVPASEEGMMGDFIEISEIDLEGSRAFLKKFVGTLEMADMMEDFLNHAHECYLGDDADRVECYYCYNLQDFTPPLNKYDVIWMQWVACHLTDKDLMEFLIRCKASLRPNGIIVIKDNMARQGCKLDPIDSSLIRHLDIVKNIIYKAGLEILGVERQQGFPEQIIPVWMIAMK